MQRINYIYIYNEELHKKLELIHKKLELRDKFHKIFHNNRYRWLYQISFTPIPAKAQKFILSTALEFMQINYEQYLDNIVKIRENNISKLNDQQESLELWNNIDKEWLSLNIDVQLSYYPWAFNAIIQNIDRSKELTACDYGCGSGALMFALNNILSFKKLDLYEIDNYASEFIRFYIQKNSKDSISWHDVLKENNTEQYDLVNCMDVLEHVEQPYEILKHISSKVKKGGLLNLKIAFECEDPTHLPQASQNFFVDNDGLKFLKENYRRVKCYSQSNFVSGLFRKK